MDHVNFLIDALLDNLVRIDERLAANDINTAMKKTHESIGYIKKFREDSPHGE